MKICKTSDLGNNASVKFKVPAERFDREAFVIKYGDTYKAFFNECPHIGLALDFDDNDFFSTDSTKLVCNNHSAEFNPNDGHCTAGPCMDSSLKPIAINIEDGEVYAIFDQS